MPTMCVAVGCYQKAKRGSYVKFYTFPRDPVRRKRWVSAVKREGWTPASHSKLCSMHFITGRRSDDPLSPDYVPSWFAHTTTEEKEKSMAAMRRYKRSQEALPNKDASSSEPAVARLGSYRTGLLAASSGKDRPVYASYPSLCEEYVKRSLMEVQTLSRNAVSSTHEVSGTPPDGDKEKLHPTSFHEQYCLPESIQWTKGAWEKVSREKFQTKRKKRYKHTIKVNEKWEWLGVDLKGPLPETQNGYKFMLILMDYYSKWVEAYPMKSESAGEVALNIQNLTYQFGWPLRILSQMDKAFIQEVNTELGALLGEQDVSLVTFHPEASTRDPVTQCFVDGMVSELVRDHQERWDVQLPASLFALRLRQHPSTGHSPFYMLYRKEPRPDFSSTTQELPLREDLISSSGLMIPEVKFFSSMQHRDTEPPRPVHILQAVSQQGQKDVSSVPTCDKQRPVFLVTPLPLAPSNTQQSDRRAAQEHIAESKSSQDQRDENNVLTEKQRKPRGANIQHPERRIVLQRIHPEDFALSV
ncbi:uncharacterized protein LOC118232196 isoform X1 [Anguilla anguilla]|uniref:uncharacterized protein LOC118232196 isoform X1 n=1 Tax=Anguilla anguilla TaxID=7936 RepID=UPI0015AECEEA|nr:uncharacterized protein LOC118232196 isoform X1 [Anguilla anguilla]